MIAIANHVLHLKPFSQL